jgi:hypothetical protein
MTAPARTRPDRPGEREKSPAAAAKLLGSPQAGGCEQRTGGGPSDPAGADMGLALFASVVWIQRRFVFRLKDRVIVADHG